MSLLGSRLSEAIKQQTKVEIIALFSSFWSGLLPAESTLLSDALDDFCHAIGYGDGGETVGEIDVHASINIPAASFGILPGSFTAGPDPVLGVGENDTISLTGNID